ncbi:MAG: 30S ribosomal protein S7 [Thermoplasmata archaeon]|nr:MAG: 30S ribosomal protein S7 [Thermoplasmata archaeon]
MEQSDEKIEKEITQKKEEEKSQEPEKSDEKETDKTQEKPQESIVEQKTKEIPKEPVKVEEEIKKETTKTPLEKKTKEKETEEGKEQKKKPKKNELKKDTGKELVPGLAPLIFDKYNLNDVVVDDPGLKRYVNLTPIGIPHTGARHANKWFGKQKVNVVERLINNMMRTEHTTGKKSFAYRTVRNAFDIIAKRTKQNPVQVLIHALQNSSPKEEITRLRFGGISVPKAVDTSSSHRLDVALRNICKGAVNSSHKNKKRMEVCLAEEIILASKADMNSFAISKKEEMERIAASAR